MQLAERVGLEEIFGLLIKNVQYVYVVLYKAKRGGLAPACTYGSYNNN